MVQVELFYKGYDPQRFDKTFRSLSKNFFGKELGSGFLLSEQTRDICFEFSSENRANAFSKAISLAFGDRVEIKIRNVVA